MACSSLLSDEDLRRFRTKPCRRSRQKNGLCEFGSDRCQYSHNDYWPRRCPFYLSNASSLRYLPRVCDRVVLGNEEKYGCSTIGTVISNSCTRGGSCPFAHSLEELLYHPLFYKTQPCERFRKQECNTYYCPFVHGIAEYRDVSSNIYNLPFTTEIFQSSPFPNVRITSKMPPAPPPTKSPTISRKSDAPSPDLKALFSPSHSRDMDEDPSSTAHQPYLNYTGSTIASESESLLPYLLDSVSKWSGLVNTAGEQTTSSNGSNSQPSTKEELKEEVPKEEPPPPSDYGLNKGQLAATDFIQQRVHALSSNLADFQLTLSILPECPKAMVIMAMTAAEELWKDIESEVLRIGGALQTIKSNSFLIA